MHPTSDWALLIHNLSWFTKENQEMIYQFQLGHFRCTVCSDGQMKPPWEPPWEAFFGVDTGVSDTALTAALTEEKFPRAGVALGYNCLCVETEGETVIIDTGLGSNFQGYGPELSIQLGKLGPALAQANLSTSDISIVILTHLHQDHVRGALCSGERTFPHAKHIVHTIEVAFWRDGLERPENADHAAVVASALALFDRQLRAVPYEYEVVPGIRTIAASGHTPGHMGILVHSDGQQLLCVGDMFYDSLQLRRPDWWTRYDVDPRQSVHTRRKLAAWAADEGMLVHAYHMPFPGIGRIRRNGQAFEWQALAAIHE
jgi:glyoxylase-like metal-dependent hydrolase (beta-lactamase superfamily II)